LSAHVVFHRLAALEARDAESWYAVRSPESAGRFRDAVLKATQQIADDTNTHVIEATRFRCVRVHGFPYRLIYVLNADSSVLVLAVAHHRRRPVYWKRCQ
jgi:toxin ParE1/3/4